MSSSPAGTDSGVPAHGDLRVWRGDLQRAYDRFQSTGEIDIGVRPVVADSWRLSRASGVSPDQVLPPIDWTEDELRAYREAHPLAAVMPIIRRLLLDDATGHSAVVAVLDADSRLLWVEGDAELRSRAESMHWVPGARWAEALAGTNAPATSLRLDRPVQIFSREHYASNVEPWSCAAAPIHHPLTGELLGALDITGRDDVALPIVLGLVRATVAAAETELRLTALSRPVARVASRTSSRFAELSVLGRLRGVVRHGNNRTVALSLRRTEMLLLLAENPGGYTAERLAVDLHTEDVAPVTVRAELSRLRSLLPDLDLQARPYRLGRPLLTDLSTVRDALAGGDLPGAVAAYRGPVLPDSESPAVERIRLDLTQEMRRAVLGSGNFETVLRFARSSSARDDRALWEHAGRLAPQSQRQVIADRLIALDAELGL